MKLLVIEDEKKVAPALEKGRLTRLIENLLTLTRADSGHVPLRLIETDLVRLVQRAAEDMRPLAEEKEQRLTLALEGPAIVRVDEATVRLALVNLLDNAIKYTPRSGTVTVGSKMRGERFSDRSHGYGTRHRRREQGPALRQVLSGRKGPARPRRRGRAGPLHRQVGGGGERRSDRMGNPGETGQHVPPCFSHEQKKRVKRRFS